MLYVIQIKKHREKIANSLDDPLIILSSYTKCIPIIRYLHGNIQ